MMETMIVLMDSYECLSSFPDRCAEIPGTEALFAPLIVEWLK
jgi:hypothetical protein